MSTPTEPTTPQPKPADAAGLLPPDHPEIVEVLRKCAERGQTLADIIAILRHPMAVYHNMVRGEIAMPSWELICNLYNKPTPHAAEAGDAVVERYVIKDGKGRVEVPPFAAAEAGVRAGDVALAEEIWNALCPLRYRSGETNREAIATVLARHHPAAETVGAGDENPQPDYADLWQAFVKGAQEARENPRATLSDFNRAADAYCKLIHAEKAPGFVALIEGRSLSLTKLELPGGAVVFTDGKPLADDFGEPAAQEETKP